MSWWERLLEWIYNHAWAIEVGIVLILLLVLNFSLKKILRRGEGEWRAHLDYAALAPARVLLWIVLVSFLIDLVVREVGLEGSFTYIPPLRSAGVILCLAWFLLRWKKVFHKTFKKKAVDPISLEMIGRLFTIAVIFITTVVVMSLFGLDVAPLITFGGIGAAAIGFASKDVIANFFGGMMLSITRPFNVGDLIELPEKKIEGHIEEIGWYFTSLRDLEKKPVYLPNSMFSTEPLINQSRLSHRLIEETYAICYEDLDKISQFVPEIKAYLDRHPKIDAELPIAVNLKEFSDVSIKIEVSAYTMVTDWLEFLPLKQKILLELYRLIEESGAKMASPMLNVFLKQL